MKFGDKVKVKDSSRLDGSIGIVYRLEGENALVLLDKEVLWPVAQDKLELVSSNE
jgi:hypothetical protein